jgi:hypothetical protein
VPLLFVLMTAGGGSLGLIMMVTVMVVTVAVITTFPLPEWSPWVMLMLSALLMT